MLTCDCPRSTHVHGDRVTYVIHKCRCPECTEAARVYEMNRRRQLLYGRSNMVDAEPARQHIRALGRQGMGWKTVARAAGLTTSTVYPILYGKNLSDPHHPEHRPPRRRIRKSTADAILAVRLDLRPGSKVDPTGARRRVQALVCAGWSIRQIADRSGIERQRLTALARSSRETTTKDTRDRIAEFFASAWEGPDEDVPKGSVTRARAMARKHGWLPALAWDDIDDPNETPDVSVLRRSRPLTVAERIEDLLVLAAAGHVWDDSVVARVGWKSVEVAERALHRAGRGDVKEALCRNGQPAKERRAG